MLIRTIRCKLECTEETAQAFSQTREAFCQACNLILAKAIEAKTHDPIALHKLIYGTVREKFGLSANLTVRAIRRVAGSLATRKKKGRPKPKHFRTASIDYDARIFSFWEKGWRVSLSTLHGRKPALLKIGDYQKQALQEKKPTSATLNLRGQDWTLNIAIEEEEPPLKEGLTIGLDLGLRNTVYTSTGFFVPGKKRQEFKEKRAKIRASLQSKGTRGAYKKLRQLSGYEKRTIRHENHNLSKQLVLEAQRHNAGLIRMEQLRGIREKTLVWNPHRNRMVAGWSFSQLQQFVLYKARRVGIAVEFVNPAYTSQVCFSCRQKGLRIKDVFRCTTCGERHADFNAACLVSIGGAVVNRPELTVCT